MALNLWIISAFISTCYTFSWDIKMDWGLFSGKYFLREQTIYSRKVRMLNNLVFDMLLILCVHIYITIAKILEWEKLVNIKNHLSILSCQLEPVSLI